MGCCGGEEVVTDPLGAAIQELANQIKSNMDGVDGPEEYQFTSHECFFNRKTRLRSDFVEICSNVQKLIVVIPNLFVTIAASILRVPSS